MAWIVFLIPNPSFKFKIIDNNPLLGLMSQHGPKSVAFRLRLAAGLALFGISYCARLFAKVKEYLKEYFLERGNI
jgi:hypothetical protein